MAKSSKALEAALFDSLYDNQAMQPTITAPLHNTNAIGYDADECLKAKEENVKTFGNQIEELNIDDLEAYHEHTYKVKDDDDMKALVASIRTIGVIEPLSVRKSKTHEGKYEILSGHRRRRGAQLAELKTVPCILRDIEDDNQSTVYMVDSNVKREQILPSERIRSCQAKHRALKEMKKLEQLENDPDFSRAQFMRFVKAGRLSDVLLEYLDNEVFGMSAAIELSNLSEANQPILENYIFKKVSAEDKFVLDEKISKKINEKASKLMPEVITEDIIDELVNGKKVVSTKKPKLKLDEKTISGYLPLSVQSAPIEKKLKFTEDALAYFYEYIKDNEEAMSKYEEN